MNTTEKLSKAEIAKRLVRFDIILSPSQVKKLSLAELEAKLVDAINAEAAKHEATRAEVAATIHGDARRADIDAAVASHPITKIERKTRGKRADDRSACTYKTPVDCRGGDGLLTERACFSRAEDWCAGKSHGLPEAGGVVDGTCYVTLTDMTTLEVDCTTGKVRKTGKEPRTVDVDQGSPAADKKPARRAAANSGGGNVVALKPRARGISIDPKPLGQQKTCRAGTVQAALIDYLTGNGATIWELQAAAPNWTEASIKSGLAYDVSRIKGYGVRTEIMTPRQAYDAGHEASVESWLGGEFEHEAIVPVYFLVLPAGMDAPLPHVESAPIKAAANKG